MPINARNARNGDTEYTKHDATLQPIVAGLSLASTKLYRTNKDGTVNVTHTSIIEQTKGRKSEVTRFGIEYELSINGVPFILRIPHGESDTVAPVEMVFD